MADAVSVALFVLFYFLLCDNLECRYYINAVCHTVWTYLCNFVHKISRLFFLLYYHGTEGANVIYLRLRKIMDKDVVTETAKEKKT